MPSENNKHVILAPGPPHLFWTTGAYYLWELSKKYTVVLIVDEVYTQHHDFNRLIRLVDKIEVVYIPPMGIFKRHRFYATEFKNIVCKYNPVFIFHHDPVYVSMMYLYHWGNKNMHPSYRISYITSLGPVNWKSHVDSIAVSGINAIANKHRIPQTYAKLLFKIKSLLSLGINYYLLPYIFIGKSFSPPMNPIDFTKLKDYWNDQFDFCLLYDKTAKDLISRVFGSKERVREVYHPLISTGEELNSMLYGLVEENNVLILPSYGHIEDYQKNKLSDKEIVDWVSSKWIKVIESMKEKFHNYNIVWKLHPAQRQDLFWQMIQENVKESCPDLVLLPPKENAQKWILRSKIIVGDVSSVLWWASLLKSKISISLDIFGIPFMDDFKNHEGIFYYNRLEDFYNTDFSKLSENNKWTDNSIPTLTEFLERLSAK